MKILLLDNYDSFTHNLYHLIEKVCDYTIEVHRNDAITIDQIQNFDKIVLSPGPGLPKDAGIMMELLKNYASTKPILGVCLGHQAVAEFFGASLINLKEVFHGVSTPVEIIKKDILFDKIEPPYWVGRYHSWVVDAFNLPVCLEVLAQDDQKNIMAIKHSNWNVKGVQFHPESIMTNFGEQLVRNWVLE